MRRALLVFAAAITACAAPSSPAPPKHADFTECSADAECDSGDCSRRLCVPHECDADDDCAGGEVCSVSNLLGNTCQAPAARGEACFTWDDTGDRTTISCAAGLECVDPGIVGLAGASICVPPDGARFVGEPCDAGHVCDVGLTCDQICLAGTGGACASDGDCESRLCPDATMTCAPNECGAAAEPCDDGTVCMNADCGRRCLPLLASGDVCRTDDACGDVLLCASLDACAADGRCP